MKYLIEMPDGVTLKRGFVILPEHEGIICEALSNAVKAVEVKQPIYNGERVWTVSTSARIFAVEEK